MEAPKAEEVKGQYIPEGDFSMVLSVSLSNKTIKHPGYATRSAEYHCNLQSVCNHSLYQEKCNELGSIRKVWRKIHLIRFCVMFWEDDHRQCICVRKGIIY